jgi:GDSL-like Lipase/Acylhydrolase family
MTKPNTKPHTLFSKPSNADSATTPKQSGGSPVLSQGTKIAFTVFFASLITLGASELGLRLLWHNPYRHESPDHLLKIRLNHPSTDHIFSRALVNSENPQGRLRTDARSYLLPSFQYSDPDATVAFLGGSTTECVAVQEDLRFPALVSGLLAEQGWKVNTLNAARSGNALHDSLNILLNHLIIDRPDIVVLMHASNDIGYLSHGDENFRSRMGHPVSIADLGKWFLQMASSNLYSAALVRYSATSESHRPKDPAGNWRNNTSLINKVPIDTYRQRLQAFINICRAFGIEPVLMTEPFSGSTNVLTPHWINRAAQDRFNAVISEVGDREGVLVIDLVRHLQERVPEWNKPMEIFYDAIHVTDKGSRVYAQHITERLLPLIVAQTNVSPPEKHKSCGSR